MNQALLLWNWAEKTVKQINTSITLESEKCYKGKKCKKWCKADGMRGRISLLPELKEEDTHAMFYSQKDPSIKRQFLNGLGKSKNRKEASEWALVVEWSWEMDISGEGVLPLTQSLLPILSPLPHGHLNAHG